MIFWEIFDGTKNDFWEIFDGTVGYVRNNIFPSNNFPNVLMLQDSIKIVRLFLAAVSINRLFTFPYLIKINFC